VVGDLTVGKLDSTFSLLLLGVSRQTNEGLRMVSVFLYHVVGDLTVGKPEIVEFLETKMVESAIHVVGDSTEGVGDSGVDRERDGKKILINKVLANKQE
jgi:hypothetical protein